MAGGGGGRVWRTSGSDLSAETDRVEINTRVQSVSARGALGVLLQLGFQVRLCQPQMQALH